MSHSKLSSSAETCGREERRRHVAAESLGGTRLFGGEGSVVGAFVGSLIMGTLTNGLILSGLSSSEQMIVQGIVLLTAISLTLREARP